MSISSKIELDNSTVADKNSPVELPSLKNTILKPRNLATILIISILLNILLIIVALTTSGGTGPTNVTVTPTKQASTTPKATNKPTLKPTQSPEELENSVLQCFRNCDVDGVIDNARSVALDINNFKLSSVLVSYKEENCYGNYLENDSPDREMNSYYPEICENSYISKPPATTIHIGDNLYVLNTSGNWSLESKPRFGQSKLIRIIDEIKAQQEKTLQESPRGQDFKQIVTSSKTINDLSQQVTKTATITVNVRLEVVDYSIEIEKVSKEDGYFFGVGENNNIQAPF
jgi:hypothetical protein